MKGWVRDVRHLFRLALQHGNYAVSDWHGWSIPGALRGIISDSLKMRCAGVHNVFLPLVFLHSSAERQCQTAKKGSTCMSG